MRCCCDRGVLTARHAPCNTQGRLSYDAFGKRRKEADWSGSVPASDYQAIGATSNRGYTGHEMLDTLDLIHMNGRVYHATTGRFFSPDPFVPEPFNSQSLNRYSYVRNSPLSFIDPTGLMEEVTVTASRLPPPGPMGPVPMLSGEDHLQTFKRRLAALEKKSAEEGLVLTERQIAALERKREEQLECGEIETAHPGYLGSQDTF